MTIRTFGQFTDEYFSYKTQKELRDLREDTLNKRINLMDQYFTGIRRLEREAYIRRAARHHSHIQAWKVKKGFAA